MKRFLAAVLLSLFALVGFAPAASADVIEASPCEYPYEGFYGEVAGVHYQFCQNII